MWFKGHRNVLKKPQHRESTSPKSNSIASDTPSRSNSVASAEEHAVPPPVPERSPIRLRPASRGSMSSGYSASSTSQQSTYTNFSYRRSSLRRKQSPALHTLREIRDKQSEAALRDIYESQTMSYLNDDIYTPPPARRTALSKWSSAESSAGEDIPEEDEEQEHDVQQPAPLDWWSQMERFSSNSDRGWPTAL